MTSVGSKWTKVAMAIARTNGLTGVEYAFIAVRLYRLVESRKLESVGDVKDWPHSEVRVAD